MASVHQGYGHPDPYSQGAASYTSNYNAAARRPSATGPIANTGYVPHGKYMNFQPDERDNDAQAPPSNVAAETASNTSYNQIGHLSGGPRRSSADWPARPVQEPYESPLDPEERVDSPLATKFNQVAVRTPADDYPPEEYQALTKYRTEPYRFAPRQMPVRRYSTHPPPLSVGWDDGYDSAEEERLAQEKELRRRERRERKRAKSLPDFKAVPEKGIKTKLLGAASGALVGHEAGSGGALGTIAGLVVGALGVTALEKTHDRNTARKDKIIQRIDDAEEKRREKRRERRRQREEAVNTQQNFDDYMNHSYTHPDYRGGTYRDESSDAQRYITYPGSESSDEGTSRKGRHHAHGAGKHDVDILDTFLPTPHHQL